MNPLSEIAAWYELARAQGVLEPEAAALATATSDGRPSVRMVLMRGVDERGLRFFTNRESRKGEQLEANPRAAMAIHWHALERQIRIEGAVAHLPERESDEYFAGRGRGSQLGAWASNQSRPIADRAELERRVEEYDARFGSEAVPRPPYWGGYLIAPDRIEFWRGRPDRLHERMLYLRDGERWSGQLLSP